MHIYHYWSPLYAVIPIIGALSMHLSNSLEPPYAVIPFIGANAFIPLIGAPLCSYTIYRSQCIYPINWRPLYAVILLIGAPCMQLFQLLETPRYVFSYPINWRPLYEVIPLIGDPLGMQLSH